MLFHPTTLSILLILFSYVSFCILRKYGSNTKLNLPPSPPKIPIFGNLHQVTPKIHLFFHQLSLQYGPLVFLKFGSKPILVASSAETATEILKTHDLIFADRFPPKALKFLVGDGNDIGMSPYNEQWKQLRKFCVVELLSPKRVQSFNYIRQEEVDRMIETIARSSKEQGIVNLTETMFTLSNAIIFRCSLGDDFNKEYTDRFIGLINKVNPLVESLNLGEFFPWLKWLDVVNGYDAKLRKTAQELNTFFDQIIDDRILIMNSQVDNSDHGKDEKRNFVDILVLHAGKNNLSLTRECMRGIII
ncbi:hypothetical protein MKW94_002108, partial [Papaver nudicaule]|nr:hypothetical protein [Papaver nudicaule]